jgi:wyosine [tRNA(Phe)-imidazoG37] synthetase (radical SAM superfamily)
MLHFDDIVFGPIRSRRLGSSLGVNLLPSKGKLCNFDCIYCECGWNRDGEQGRTPLPAFEDIKTALTERISALAEDGSEVDSITFSGNGEPTIHPDFPEIVDVVLELRDRYYPEAKVSVLSNATMLGREKVREALKKIDNPILKIDASYDGLIALINKPAGNYRLEDVVGWMKEFGGDFILQTMFLRSDDFDLSAPDQLAGWMDIVRYLNPREVMVYTIDRETPDKSLGKYTVDEMRTFVAPLIDEGYKIQIRG